MKSVFDLDFMELSTAKSIIQREEKKSGYVLRVKGQSVKREETKKFAVIRQRIE